MYFFPVWSNFEWTSPWRCGHSYSSVTNQVVGGLSIIAISGSGQHIQIWNHPISKLFENSRGHSQWNQTPAFKRGFQKPGCDLQWLCPPLPSVHAWKLLALIPGCNNYNRQPWRAISESITGNKTQRKVSNHTTPKNCIGIFPPVYWINIPRGLEVWKRVKLGRVSKGKRNHKWRATNTQLL